MPLKLMHETNLGFMICQKQNHFKRLWLQVLHLFGGIMPLFVSLFMPLKNMIFYQYGFAILFLIILGSVSAKIGGAKVFKAILRVTFWGTIAMLLSALVGYLFGVNMV